MTPMTPKPMKWFVAIAPVVAVALSVALSAISSLPGIPSETIVFRNVAAFDGSRLIPRTNVVVRDGMIRAVGADVVIPASAQIVEGEGRTLLPGLIDAHTHLGVMFGEQFLKDALIFGVTTELEMWGGEASRALRNASTVSDRDHDRDRADLRTAGTGITAPKGHPTQMGTLNKA
jgi:imidazolonepropionase-like amidohydrolase